MSDERVRISVVIPTRNNIGHLTNCLNSLYRTLDTTCEVILVANGSEEERVYTAKQCNAIADAAKIPTHVLMLEKEPGFPAAVNLGMRHAKGEHIILLNDDTIVSSKWLALISDALTNARSQFPTINWGFVGPVSNRVIPIQDIGKDLPESNDPTQVEAVQDGLLKQDFASFIPAASLSGFCLLITREAYEAIGEFDEETFTIGGFCDNDYILRGIRLGFRALVACFSFVYHVGHTTLDRVADDWARGLINRPKFMKKWRQPKPQTVCANYRVKIDTEDAYRYFVMSLKRAKDLCQEAVVLDDRSEIDILHRLKEEHPDLREFITHYKKKSKNEGLSEAADRDCILQIAQKTGCDWTWNIDHDEVISDHVTPEKLQKLLNPFYIHLEAYTFPVRTLWRGDQLFRADDIWGKLKAHTLIRNLPGQGGIQQDSNTPFHCRRVHTATPMDSVRPTNAIAFKHYGYEKYEECKRKKEWYESLDKNPVPTLVGAAHYNHLTREAPLVALPYAPKTVTMAMLVKDELFDLSRILMEMGDWVDDIIICETAGNEEVIKWLEDMKLPYLSWRCCDKATEPNHFMCDFSEVRNWVADQVKTDYVLFMDPDESIPINDLVTLNQQIQEDRDAYIFEIRNIQPSGKVYQTMQPRLFKAHHPVMRYTSRIHESLEDNIRDNKDKVEVSLSGVAINHFGYIRKQKGTAERSQKNRAYAEHLQKLLETNPKDARALFSLGQHYNSELRDYDHGDPLIAEAVSLEPNFFNARFELTMRFMRRAYDLLRSTPQDSIPTKEKRVLWERAIQTLHPWVLHEDEA